MNVTLDQRPEALRKRAVLREQAASSRRKRSLLRRGAILCLLLTILFVAAALRLHRLGDLAYWFDESYGIRTAELSPRKLMTSCMLDVHPPLFYFMLKAWVACFGHGEWEARFLSTLWSLGAVATAFGFTYEGMCFSKDRPSNRSVALLAATLAGLCIALSPIQISWAQQVRMYAPSACLAILGTWLLWRAVQEPHRWRHWISYAVVEVAGLYLHVTMLFIFAAHVLAIWGILIQGRKDWSATKFLFWRAAIVMGTVGLIALPWVLVVRMQHARVQDDYWIPPFTLKFLSTTLVQCFTVYQHQVLDFGWGLWIGQGMLLICVCVAAGKRPFDLLLALSASLPFLLLIAASQGGTNVINARYFVAGHALVCLAVSVWVARLPTWFLKLPAATLLLGTLIFLAQDQHQWRESVSGPRAIPELLERWREYRDTGQPLVFCNPTYYLTAHADHGGEGLKIVGVKNDYPHYNGTAVTSDEEYLSAAQIDAGDWETVWVCDTTTGGRNRPPVAMGNAWRLSGEILRKDYSGTFSLKRYDRIP